MEHQVKAGVYRAFPAHTYRICIYTAGGAIGDQSDEY